MDGISSTSLSDEALKRKERLKALKSKQGGSSAGDGESNETNSDEHLPRPVFRNYQPQDDSLKSSILPKAKPVSVDEEVKSHLETAESVLNEVNLTSLAPRKPDWDLKRDISKKLDILEKRTQKAIIELIKERLKSNIEEDNIRSVNLAEAVNYIEKSQDVDSDND